MTNGEANNIQQTNNTSSSSSSSHAKPGRGLGGRGRGRGRGGASGRGRGGGRGGRGHANSNISSTNANHSGKGGRGRGSGSQSHSSKGPSRRGTNLNESNDKVNNESRNNNTPVETIGATVVADKNKDLIERHDENNSNHKTIENEDSSYHGSARGSKGGRGRGGRGRGRGGRNNNSGRGRGRGRGRSNSRYDTEYENGGYGNENDESNRNEKEGNGNHMNDQENHQEENIASSSTSSPYQINFVQHEDQQQNNNESNLESNVRKNLRNKGRGKHNNESQNKYGKARKNKYHNEMEQDQYQNNGHDNSNHHHHNNECEMQRLEHNQINNTSNHSRSSNNSNRIVPILEEEEQNYHQQQQHSILGIPVNTIPTLDRGTKNNSKGQAQSASESKGLHRIESSASILSEKDAKAGSAGPIDLLKHQKQSSSSSSSHPSSNKEKDKSTKTKRSKKSKKAGNNLHNDEIAKQRAAKAFNSAVRKCVERSDPDGLYDLLHSKNNHKFALHADVLETVLKAFVVAAMFDEALYCCRNCTRPGTLSTVQAERILQCLPQNLRNSSAYVAADMINALCIATEFDKPTHRTYFMRIVRGIALEFLEEATSARDRICSALCERLVRSSVCVVDAKLRRGKKATDLVVLPGKQLGVFVPDSMENRGIQAGDAVGILPYAGPYPMSAESLDRNMIEATVAGLNPMILRLQDRTNANLYATLTEPSEGNVYRIDKLANRMGFNRQLAAAVAIATPLEKDAHGVAVVGCDMRRPSPELIQAITAMDENIDRNMINGNVSRKYDSDEFTSTATLCAQPVPFTTMEDRNYNHHNGIRKADQNDADSIRDAARLALEKYNAFEGLNASQRLAVEGAATNRLTLVQGPPGTGKTAVAIRIIQHWARLAASEALPGQYPKPILATSDSNIAVDNLVEGCANVGLKVVRLGRPEAIRPELLRFCIDRPQNNRSQNNDDFYGYGNQNSYASIYKEKIKALKSAQIICCTCIGSGADILDNMTFERVLVDEATQATEPAVLVPLTRLCRQLVLVGDHCQLPPTVLSTRAEEEGLAVPLFSRMVACGVPPFMLDTQYRMHPSIAMFPSDLFYGGKLLNGVSPPERRPLAGFPWPREEFPVAFVPVPNGVEIDDGVSKMNEAEAAAACDAVEALLKGGQCRTSDIAVVTPYAAQVRLIRRLTRKLVSNPPYVEVSSTDGFQGREKEAVVFSAVRSNDYGSVGFVSDWRRVNVSFTRARRALIVIGNDITLRRGDPDTWMPWLEWVNAHGVNMDRPGKTRGRYEPEQLRRVRGGTTAAEMLKDVLERQQEQLQKAEKQIKNAQKKSSNQIIGSVDGTDEPIDQNSEADAKLRKIASELSLQNDLALLSNADGNWDDEEEDGNCNEIQNSTSVATLTSMTSSTVTKVDEPQDAWDL